MRYKFVDSFSNLSSFFKKKFKKLTMSALDSVEIDTQRGPEVTLSDASLAGVVRKKKQPKRVLYFSDGTIEEYDSDETDEDAAAAVDGVEQPFRKAKDSGLEAEPPADPKTLTWPAWIKHFTVAGGSKTLHAMDRLGEGLAYHLGITTPKYQYEIDEYYRAKEEELAAKKLQDTELQTWATPDRNQEVEAAAPIVSQPEVVTETPKALDV